MRYVMMNSLVIAIVILTICIHSCRESFRLVRPPTAALGALFEEGHLLTDSVNWHKYILAFSLKCALLQSG